MFVGCSISISYCQQTSIKEDSCNDFSIELKGGTTLCFEQDTTLLLVKIEGGSPQFKYQWKNGSTLKETKVNITNNVYPSVTVTDALGCKLSKRVQLKRITSDGIRILPTTPTICPNNGFVVLKSWHKSNSYQWINLDSPQKVIGIERELKVIKPGRYRLNTTLIKNETTCLSSTETKVFDLSDRNQIEEYLILNGFYALNISHDQGNDNKSVKSITNSSSHLKKFIPFRFLGIHL